RRGFEAFRNLLPAFATRFRAGGRLLGMEIFGGRASLSGRSPPTLSRRTDHPPPVPERPWHFLRLGPEGKRFHGEFCARHLQLAPVLRNLRGPPRRTRQGTQGRGIARRRRQRLGAG